MPGLLSVFGGAYGRVKPQLDLRPSDHKNAACIAGLRD
jgi:hypothetical protein